MLGLTKISVPKRLISPKVVEGQEVVVHRFTASQVFFQITFVSKRGKLLHEISVDDHFKLSPAIRKEIQSFVKAVENSNSVYTFYNYLFLAEGENIALLSVMLDEIPLGYGIVCAAGKDLDIPVVPPMWKGLYNMLNIAAFYEDIFIQKT